MAEIVTRIETVTPETAARYLETNTHNRPLRKAVVDRLANFMKRNEFLLTHQGIAFNCDGTLLDGQHRLAAIVQSGCTVQLSVSRNVPSAAQVAMDDHARRGLHDVTGLAMGEHIGTEDAAVVRAAVEFQRRTGVVTRQEFIDLWPLLKDGVRFTKKPTTKRSITVAPARQGLALAYYYEADLERLKAANDILNGDATANGDSDRAMVTLREFLLIRRTRGGGGERMETGRKVQRAVQAFCRYESLTKLHAPAIWPYPFPLTSARVR